MHIFFDFRIDYYNYFDLKSAIHFDCYVNILNHLVDEINFKSQN
jgi:hypothetical protein